MSLRLENSTETRKKQMYHIQNILKSQLKYLEMAAFNNLTQANISKKDVDSNNKMF